MTGVAVFGSAAGVLLALRQFKVFVLIPAVFLTIIAVLLHSLVTGIGDFRAILIDLVVGVSSVQIAYLVGTIAVEFMTPSKPRDKVTELLRIVRTSIGQELRTVFELPQDLPPEMVAVLARLDRRPA
jgi:uncharacterized membrane protein